MRLSLREIREAASLLLIKYIIISIFANEQIIYNLNQR